MVAGAWDEKNEETLQLAFDVGKELALRNHIVITGGGSGTPYYVNKGVNSVDGNSISFLQGSCTEELDKFDECSKIQVRTEMGWDGRSVIAVKSCKSLIVLGGCNGTLNEITLAYLHNIPIYVMNDSSELIIRLKSFLLEGKYIDYRKNIPIIFFYKFEEIITSL